MNTDQELSLQSRDVGVKYFQDVFNYTAPLSDDLNHRIKIMRLIKIKEVIKITSLSRATIYKYMAEDSFPKPVSLGAKAVAWVEDEVENWIMDKIERRTN